MMYVADPQSQHAIWHDLGALLYEAGARAEAACLHRSALLLAHER